MRNFIGNGESETKMGLIGPAFVASVKCWGKTEGRSCCLACVRCANKRTGHRDTRRDNNYVPLSCVKVE